MMPSGPSEGPRAPLAIAILILPVLLLDRRADSGYGAFKDKTPGDPNDPIAFESLVRAEAAQVLGIT
jgi:hypothetical protein